MKTCLHIFLLIYIFLLSLTLPLSTFAEPGEQNPATKNTPKNLDFGTYLKNLQHCIQARWKLADIPGSHQVRTSFYILPSGGIKSSTITIENPQENSEQDIQAARTALEEASKECIFPLPDGAPPKVKVEFTFTDHGGSKEKKW